MDNIIFYHKNCPDGLAGAFAAYQQFGKNARYVPIISNQNIPKNICSKANAFATTNIFFIDVCLKADNMIKILNQALSITIIDHHITSERTIQILRERSPIAKLKIIFDKLSSGCKLAWEYFCPDRSLPRAFEYIHDDDIGTVQYEETKFFITGINSTVPYEIDSYGKLLDQEYVDQIISTGKIIYLASEKEIEKIITTAIETNFVCPDKTKYRVLAVNSSIYTHRIAILLSSKRKNRKYRIAIGDSPKVHSTTLAKTVSEPLLINSSDTHIDFVVVWYYDGSNKQLTLILKPGSIDIDIIIEKFGGENNMCSYSGPISDIFPDLKL